MQDNDQEFPGGLATYLEKMKQSATAIPSQEADDLQKTKSIQGSYSSTPVDFSKGLTFGDALTHLKAGDRVTRKGWNGKNMFVFKQNGNPVRKELIPLFASFSDQMKVFLLQQDRDVIFQDSLVMYTADGTLQPGWLASQQDMLANDWEVLP